MGEGECQHRSTLMLSIMIGARSGLTVDDLDRIIGQAQTMSHLGETVEHSLDA